MSNIIKQGNTEIIFNGGDPLPGCPSSYDEANAWAEEANKDKGYEPKWKFDCGFKLDFDGPIVSVESRFYPPKSHYGTKWDGSLKINFLGNTVCKVEFEEDTLDELKIKVESYIKIVNNSLSIIMEHLNRSNYGRL